MAPKNNLLISCLGVALLTPLPTLAATAAKAPAAPAKAAPAAASTSGWSMVAEAGLGYDSNVYRAPSDAYVDYGATGNPFITPKTKSGMFVPLYFKAEHLSALSRNNLLVLDYKFNGDFYVGSGQSNANNYSHRITAGSLLTLKQANQDEDTVYGGLVFDIVHRLYLDRDTGTEQETTAGTDISSRYSYTSLGVEAEYSNTTGKLDYGVDARLLTRNYDDPVVVRQYDHTYLNIGGEVKAHVAKHSILSVRGEYYTYDYDERLSRSAQGALLTSSPARKYTYNKLDTTLRQRLSDDWLVYLDFTHTTRDDAYVGYDDYTKNALQARVLYDWSKSTKAKLTLAVDKIDYPNAYAFDDPTQAAKTVEGTTVKLSTTTEIGKQRTVLVDLEYVKDDASDLRYNYSRTLAMVSLRQEF